MKRLDHEKHENEDAGKPIPVFDIDISKPIDTKKTIEGLGGEPIMFYTMLGKFEDLSLTKQMGECAKAVDDQDYLAMKNAAHSLKGSSGYVGASHLHYACYFIQEHYIFDRYEQMMEYYPTLIEAAVVFRIYSRKLLAEWKSNLAIWSINICRGDI